MRNPQQRARDAAAALELAGVADITGHVDRVFPRGGEAGGDVAGRSGRLAPRALGRAAPAALAAGRARPPTPQRAQLARQDATSQTRRIRPLRHHRSAPAARLLRHSVPLKREVKRIESPPVGQRDATEIVAVLRERVKLRK